MSKISANRAVIRTYLHNGKEMDERRTAQELRDAYFELSGQSFRVGQGHCSAFSTKAALITEIHRLLDLYAVRPEAIAEVAAAEKVKAVKHAEQLRRKAEKAEAAAAKIAAVEKKTSEFMALDDNALEIILAALATIQARRPTPILEGIPTKLALNPAMSAAAAAAAAGDSDSNPE
jgi:hypothetical protein